jgi:hypothetical protein
VSADCARADGMGFNRLRVGEVRVNCVKVNDVKVDYVGVDGWSGGFGSEWCESGWSENEM